MTEENPLNTTSQPNPSVNVATHGYATKSSAFGQQFYQTRKAKGKTLEDATKELHILKRHLKAIETEDFAALPQMAFARGFVYNYAKYLGLNPEQMVERFNAVYPEELRKGSVHGVRSPLKPMGTLQRDSKRSWRINPLLLLGVAFLIGLAVFLLRTVSNAQNEVQQEDDVVIDNMTDSEQLAGAAVTGEGADQQITEQNSSGSALDLSDATNADVSEDGSAERGQTAQTSNPTTSATTNAGLVPSAVDGATVSNVENAQLEFWVRGDTNVSVVDAAGQQLLSGLQTRGGYNVTGKPPFSIKLDNASNVALTINQERVRISDYAQNNQANFTLAP